MKKVFSLLVVVCLLVSVFSINVFAAEEAVKNTLTKGYTETFNSQLYRGDVTGDSKLTIEDASEYLRVASKIKEPKANVDYDLTKDGKITTADARKALRIASGLESTATDEEIFQYFLNEINSVKNEKPGYLRTATGTCKAAKITITGAPLKSLNATNMEYVDYLKKNKTMFVLALGGGDAGQAEYNKMIAEAQSVYEPQVNKKVIEAGSSQHYTYFPVQGLSPACSLKMEDIEDIVLNIVDSHYIITVTFKDYTYDESNPYPATSAEYKSRQQLPYGKIFNLPEFNDEDKYELNKVKLEDGKVTVKMNSTTGEIINVDYYFKYTADMTVINNSEEDTAETKDMVTKMTNTVVLDEYFDMTIKTKEQAGIK